ncbi:precorrin-8X methylmutase [Lentilitoribacter sp. Alg239-R112]|jgi:precorrin-8X/cobalt-precorrin-8 methylmutase|uniref:precorrin-8X methylmutase n=1 Tax=Lentilitoribacter sp. Alg239-R112 TaxID=2305987 RepID=UPI0013A6941E|nr:precorrin-8X methylmutase [Lentilitoribacter sp. Alg239-R112]
MSSLSYERNPAEIYRKSFETIRQEVDLSRFGKGLDQLVIRLIHSCGMVDIADDVFFSKDAFTSGRNALENGAKVFCDVEMVRKGIIPRMLPSENEVVCLVNDPDVPNIAQKKNTTRSAAQVDLWKDQLKGSIVSIGNAPTALFRLLELLDEGCEKPALIIGMPVGFVGAVESKAELAANPRGVPFVTVAGRRGGSAMAAAAVNALAGGLNNNG